MFIESVRANAFGQLVDDELTFGPGLTVIVGGNESGKSTWHAATTTALTGRRRIRGRQTDPQLTRYEPWCGSPWQVSCVVQLASGRRLRLVHDLAAKTSQAFDEVTGVEVTAEFSEEGNVDASTLVGLNRLTFPLVSSVRQADILALSTGRDRDADVQTLRTLLQHAVSSRQASDTSADDAISRLAKHASDNIGTERASSKPLRRALEAVATAEERKASAAAAFVELRKLEANHHDAEADVARLEAREAAAETDRLVSAAQEAAARLRRAEELMATAATAGPAPDAELIDVARETLAGLARHPAPAPSKAAEIERLTAQLDALPRDEAHRTAPDPAVERAVVDLDVASEALARHDGERVTAPDPWPHDLSAGRLREHAAMLEVPTPGAPPPAPRPNLGLLTILAVVALGGAAATGSIAAVATAVLAVAAGIFWIFGRDRAPEPEPAANPALTAVETELHAAHLTADPAALRAEADAVDTHHRRIRAAREWQASHDRLLAQADHARATLAERLDRAGHRPPGAETAQLQSALDAFRVARDRTAELDAAMRERRVLESQLAAARADERARDEAHHSRSPWIERLDGVGRRIGLPPLDDAENAADHTDRIAAWIRAEDKRVAEASEAHAAQAVLDQLLDGTTVEALREHAAACRARAEAAGGDLGRRSGPFDEGAHRRLLAELQVARQHADTLGGGLAEARRNVPDLALVREDVNRAVADAERLQRQRTLFDAAIGHLEEARREVHRDIAPVIAAATNDHLARVSGGRYKKVRIDPEQLSVQVELADGTLRPAESLSHGTNEQIYLLARAAIAATVAGDAESCPLLLDDVTVHADDERTDALLGLFADMAADRQVILFSQERHVHTWAENLQTTTPINLINLGTV